MTGAVDRFASESIMDEETSAADAIQKWFLAMQRRQDFLELYPHDGTASQKSSYVRVTQDIRAELLSLEEHLARSFSRLHRARRDIDVPFCPHCWIDDEEQIEMRHEIDHRYDRTDHDYYCARCGATHHIIERSSGSD